MPFEVLIEHVQNGADYAAHAGSTYTAKQTLNIAYDLAFCTGVFNHDLCNWQMKPANTKSWATFQTFMAERYNKWQQEHKNAAGQQYGMVNAVLVEDPMFEQRTIDAIASLATVTVSNCGTVALLTVMISELTLELNNTQTKLVRVAALQTNKENIWPGNNNRTGRPGGHKGKPANRHYCWTHGFLCTHHSGECPDLKPDQIITAKSRNTQGGSQANKTKWVKIVTGQQ